MKEQLLVMAEGLKKTKETQNIFDLLNNVAFTLNLFVRDYYLMQTGSAHNTEVLMTNIRGCIDAMIQYIPEKLKQLPSKNE